MDYIEAQVLALTSYNGELIAGGRFTTAGGAPCYNIARWDGTSWQALGVGRWGGSAVDALTVYNGELIAGGSFDTAGGVTCYNIARWDGTRWHALGTEGTGMNSMVWALTVYNGELIAGGWFTTAGGVSANYIARWDGTNWQLLGTGRAGGWPPVYVSALGVYNGELIAGGRFETAGGVSANNIARWNGTIWQPLGTGMAGGSNYHDVCALTVYNGELIAGGRFGTAGDVPVFEIARWDGANWQALGAGMGGAAYPGVFALTVYNDELIAGGDFYTAGGNPANNVAHWGCPPAACCFADGTCQMENSTECAALGGTYQGDDATCTPNPCQGACCYADYTCAITTQEDCTGNWLGLDSSCEQCPQPPATGACCSTTGTCSVITQAACTGAAGHYYGDSTACRTGNKCPASCKGDMNCDGRVTFVDIDLFVAALSGESAWTHWPCPWINADCNNSGTVTFADLDPFVALIGTTCP
jgi:hypothetical protein